MKEITILAFVVLLPIVPSYLLYRALPSTGAVAGKLQGLELKLGGAFAGYFAVVLLIFYHYDKLFPPPQPPSAFVWHLSGQVIDDTGVAVEPLQLQDFSFSPPWLTTIPGGNFKLTVPTEPQEGGGTAWPMLVISHDGYLPTRIPLSSMEIDADTAKSLSFVKDEDHKSISMRRITLKKAPPYQPNSQQAKQISGPKPHLKKNTKRGGQ